MIIGIGTDICEIQRIIRSIDRYGIRFISKILTEKEMNYCSQSGHWSYDSIAARFAAKEAFYKAWPFENVTPFWHDVEISHQSNLKPMFSLSQKLNRLVAKKKYTIHLSISHERKYAIAYVCIEKIHQDQI